MNILNYLELAAVLSLLTGLSVLIHEMGHFLAAKITGIPITTISIGAGPALYRFSIKGVQIRIAPIPGGYVRANYKNDHDFFKIPISRRILYYLGGLSANLFMGIGLLFIIYMFSKGTASDGAAKEVSSLAHLWKLYFEGNKLLTVVLFLFYINCNCSPCFNYLFFENRKQPTKALEQKVYRLRQP